MTKQTKSSKKVKNQVKLQFDWDLIQSFLAVIDHGSLLAAARTLGRSQPTMGRHIDLLESQLGVVLFERTGRALVPTHRGLSIAVAARTMQSGVDQVCRLVQSQDEKLSGTVRISASRVVATHLLPEIVPRIQTIAPDIDIAIVATDEVSNLLRRDADIAIRMVRPKQSSLIAKRLGEMAIIPCASQTYIDRWGLPRATKDLLNHRLIGPDQNQELLQGLTMMAKSLGADPSHTRMVVRTDDFVTQISAIRAGVGVGFVAQFLVKQHSELVPLSIDLPIPPLPVWLAVHREIRTTPRIRLVFDELSELLREHLTN